MPKNIPQPVPTEENGIGKSKDQHDNAKQEPLSGSKKVKNRNHSRNNHAEGS